MMANLAKKQYLVDKAWTNQELAFVLYNNRTQDLVLDQVLHRWAGGQQLQQTWLLERELIRIRQKYEDPRTVNFKQTDFDQNAPDVRFKPADLAALSSQVKKLLGQHSPAERQYLQERQPSLLAETCGRSVLAQQLPQHLHLLGLTRHPALAPLLPELEGDGICIPLWQDGKLINLTCRHLDITNKLKYCQAVPDLDLWSWGEGETWFLAEGLFDAYAIAAAGLGKAWAPSSAVWSVLQLLQLLEAMREQQPKQLIIWADHDGPGMRAALMLLEQFSDAQVWLSMRYKDPAESLTAGETADQLRKFTTVAELLNYLQSWIAEHPGDKSFDFTRHLQTRKFS